MIRGDANPARLYPASAMFTDLGHLLRSCVGVKSRQISERIFAPARSIQERLIPLVMNKRIARVLSLPRPSPYLLDHFMP